MLRLKYSSWKILILLEVPETELFFALNRFNLANSAAYFFRHHHFHALTLNALVSVYYLTKMLIKIFII